MAIIHRASITPTKAQLLERMLGSEVTMLGGYRFDDPAGEVGVEALLAAAGGVTKQVVLAYRGSPLQGADEHLLTTMEHSVLGRRWVYDGTRDPVSIACFARALRGEQDQAPEEVWEDGERVGSREPTVRLSLVPGDAFGDAAAPAIATDLDHEREPSAGPYLRASWDGDDAVVATLS